MNRLTRIGRCLPVFVMLALFLATDDSGARQFRSARPIASATPTAVRLPEGARAVEKIVPLPQANVQPAVERVISAWNTDGLDKHLSEAFFDRYRLLYAVDTVAPRDAKLRLQSIESIQTLQQYIEADPTREDAERLVSKVTVTARTQLEFNSPATGFQRRPGINQFLLKITHPEQGRAR